MSNKQQTAVEWLMDRLPHSIETQFSKQIEQAKELEKQQIIDACQQERMYSEEEVLKLWNWLNDGFIIRKSLPTREELIGWFEQFKKK